MKASRRNAIPVYALGAAVLSLAVGAVVGVIALAQNSNEILRIEQPVDQDVYAVSREVNVLATVDGDLVAAGQRVTVDREVTGDIIAAAQNVEIRSAVHDDVRAAGQHLRFAAPVAGHVVAAGQTVKVEQQISDWAWLAGHTVEVSGNIGGDLKIAAQTITINSQVDGNVELIGDALNLGPEAIVRGDLTWRSENKADVDSGAHIDGTFVEEPLPKVLDDDGVGGALFFTFSIIVAVIVLYLLFPRSLRESANRIASNPVKALALGFALLVATPVLAVLLLVTKLGVWLGLGLLGIYVVVLLLGVLTGLFAVSDLLLRRFRPQPSAWQALAAVFATVVVVGLLTYVPWVGFFTVLAIWLFGIGALGLQFARGYAELRA